MNTSTENMTPEKADWMARCFVNGAKRHATSGKVEPLGGEFHDRFIAHPWVRASITEGWGRDLRAHLIRVVRVRLMRGLTYDDIDELMPPREWVEAARTQAQRFKAAADWQKENMPNGIVPKGIFRSMPMGDDE